MTNAGWYPDPAGAADTYRYWDGQSWSQMTTSQPPEASAPEQPPAQPSNPTPYGQPPTEFAPQPQAPQYPQNPHSPQPPQSYGSVPPTGGYPSGGYPSGGYGVGGPGQGQWNQTSGGSGGGGGKTIALIIAAVVALVLVGVGGFFGVRALSDDDGDSKADDNPSKSEATDGSESSGATDETGPTGPTDATSSTVRPTGIQCTGGTPAPAEDPGTAPSSISGGGLTIPVQPGFTVDTAFSEAFPFADSILVQYAEVAESWVAEYAVGGIPRANGFDDPAETAEIMMQCLTMNDSVYRGFDSRTDLTNEAITVDGKPAHSITSEIRVKDPEVSVEGDVTTVIVVDTGDPDTYGVFISAAPIGDAGRIADAEAVAGSIKVG